MVFLTDVLGHLEDCMDSSLDDEEKYNKYAEDYCHLKNMPPPCRGTTPEPQWYPKKDISY